jgi:hypothetical protein
MAKYFLGDRGFRQLETEHGGYQSLTDVPVRRSSMATDPEVNTMYKNIVELPVVTMITMLREEKRICTYNSFTCLTGLKGPKYSKTFVPSNS